MKKYLRSMLHMCVVAGVVVVQTDNSFAMNNNYSIIGSEEQGISDDSSQEIEDSKVETKLDKDTVANVPCENLRKVINSKLGRGEITDPVTIKDIESMTGVFDANFKGITSLEGMQHAKNITMLAIKGNGLSDLSPISGLTNLTQIYAYTNEFTDLSQISGLTNLVYLNFGDNKIKDISPIKDMHKLEKIFLYQNQIEDITPVKDMKNLWYLDVRQNNVKSLHGLEELTSLKELYVYQNQIKDLSPIKNLTGLTKLYFNNNQVVDLSPLSNLANLQAVFASSQLIYLEEMEANSSTCVVKNPFKGVNGETLPIVNISDGGSVEGDYVIWGNLHMGTNMKNYNTSVGVNIGNASVLYSAIVRQNIKVVDNIAPSIEIVLSESDWTREGIDMNISAKDDLSGVNKIVLPNGNEVYDNEAIFSVSENGEYKFLVYDNEGNVSEKIIPISNIDSNSPEVDIEGTIVDKKYVIKIKVNDFESGVEYVILPDGTKVDFDGKNEVETTLDNPGAYSIIAVDKVGNEKIYDFELNKIEYVQPENEDKDESERDEGEDERDDNESERDEVEDERDENESERDDETLLENKENNNHNPKTGDNGIAIYIIGLAISMISIVLVNVKKKTSDN